MSLELNRRLDSRYVYTGWHEAIIYETDGVFRSLRFYKLDISSHGIGGYYVGKLLNSLSSNYYMLIKGLGKVYFKLSWYIEESIDSFRFGLRILNSQFPCNLSHELPKGFHRIRHQRRKKSSIEVKSIA